jgi:hypothetical protein
MPSSPEWSEALDHMPTLRDKYAMAALTGLLANSGVDITTAMRSQHMDIIPRSAFALADFMLYLRDKNDDA